jgi:hypothetical protein
MPPQDKSLLLLCGDTERNPAGYSTIACLSLARRLMLEHQGIHAVLFSDFGPDEEAGAWLDAALFRHLDEALHAEAAGNPVLKWAPLCYLPIQFRLSRYLWLKHCLRNLLARTGASSMCLSSSADKDLTSAITAVCLEAGCVLEIGDEPIDQTTSAQYRVRFYGLPTSCDPACLVRLRWRLWRFLHGRRACAIQPYWNLELSGRQAFQLKVFSAINLLGRAKEKVLQHLGLRPASGNVDQNLELDTPRPTILQSPVWKEWFSGDEIRLANMIIESFVREYPAGFLDRMARNLEILLQEIGARNVILMNDRLDACRLLAFVARRCGVKSGYLPHGITIEDYSGSRTNSPFQPDRMLAWNQPSRHAFEAQNWPAVVVAHPQFAPQPQKFRGLHKAPEDMRVLVLTSDWVCFSQAGREDCTVVDLNEICRGLVAFGIRPGNIDAKFHSTNDEINRAKARGLNQLRDATAIQFEVIRSEERTAALIPGYDLVVMGLTSGIYEAVMAGVPLVVFGTSSQRVGGIRGFGLPLARNGEGLSLLLRNYDNRQQEAAYHALADSLRTGASLTAVCC